jgi:hypothetical protein
MKEILIIIIEDFVECIVCPSLALLPQTRNRSSLVPHLPIEEAYERYHHLVHQRKVGLLVE